jgi:cell division protein FtsW
LFSSLVAQGIGLWIGVQAIINMGVNMGVLPTKGLTLPLMSFGGSAIAANCIAIAILLRIDWENRQLMQGRTV